MVAIGHRKGDAPRDHRFKELRDAVAHHIPGAGIVMLTLTFGILIGRVGVQSFDLGKAILGDRRLIAAHALKSVTNPVADAAARGIDTIPTCPPATFAKGPGVCGIVTRDLVTGEHHQIGA